jgi:hypothetical protein
MLSHRYIQSALIGAISTAALTLAGCASGSNGAMTLPTTTADQAAGTTTTTQADTASAAQGGATQTASTGTDTSTNPPATNPPGMTPVNDPPGGNTVLGPVGTKVANLETKVTNVVDGVSTGGGDLLGGVLHTAGNAVLTTGGDLDGLTPNSPLGGGLLTKVGSVLSTDGTAIQQKGLTGTVNSVTTPVAGLASATVLGQNLAGVAGVTPAVGIGVLAANAATGSVASVNALTGGGNLVSASLGNTSLATAVINQRGVVATVLPGVTGSTGVLMVTASPTQGLTIAGPLGSGTLPVLAATQVSASGASVGGSGGLATGLTSILSGHTGASGTGLGSGALATTLTGVVGGLTGGRLIH